MTEHELKQAPFGSATRMAVDATVEKRPLPGNSLIDILRTGDLEGLSNQLDELASRRPLSAREVIYRCICLAQVGKTSEAVTSLSADLLADPRHRTLLRNHAIRPAIQQKRYTDATEFARTVATAAPDDPSEILHFAEALLSCGHRLEGEAQLARLDVRELGHSELATKNLKLRLRHGFSSGAAAQARNLVQFAGVDPRIDHLCLSALMRVDDLAHAAMLIAIVARSGTLTSDFAVLGTGFLLKHAEARAASELCSFALQSNKSVRLHLVAERAFRAAGLNLEADEQIHAAGELDAEDPEIGARRIYAFLRTGNVKSAARLARRWVTQEHHSTRIEHACLRALLDAGEPAFTEPILARAAAGAEVDLPTAILAMRAFVRLSRPREAVALGVATLSRQHEPSVPLHLEIARTMYLAKFPLDEIVPYFEAARALEPDNPLILQILGKAQLGMGRFDQATMFLKKAVELSPRGVNVMLFAKALRFAKRYQEAADVMVDNTALLGDSPQWKRQTAAALIQAGRVEQATVLYKELVAERADKLACDFTTHLGTLDQQPSPESIPQSRVDWAWDTVTRLKGAPPSADRADWERRALWGFKADRAILDWVECRPDRIGEVVGVLRDVSTAAQPLFDLLKLGRGLFIVGAHIGPMYAGPVVVQAAGVPFKVVAQMPRISSASYAPHLISTIDQAPLAVARQILAAVGDNKAVVVTADAAMNPSAARVDWEGESITHTDFMATIGFRRGVPSVFAQPFWVGSEIRFVVNALPVADRNETEGDFVLRWRAAYFDELRTVLLDQPENLRLAEGIWRSIPAD